MSVRPDWLPVTAESGPQTHEYLPVVILDGQEYGLRDQIDICTSYVEACDLGRVKARHVRRGASYVVLRREVGAWEQWPS